MLPIDMPIDDVELRSGEQQRVATPPVVVIAGAHQRSRHVQFLFQESPHVAEVVSFDTHVKLCLGHEPFLGRGVEFVGFQRGTLWPSPTPASLRSSASSAAERRSASQALY